MSGGGHPEPVDGIVTDEPTVGPQTPSGASASRDPAVQRFRDWLGDHIWAEDDMGGFLQCGTALTWREEQAQMMANVAQLFDLLDPDWRSFTWSGRRGGSGRRPDLEGG